MEGLLRPRLMVCARGIEAWVRRLCDRADHGDQEAERALEKLRDAFETALKVLGDGPELREDEFLTISQGLLILDRALQGSHEYPREVLRRIAKQTAEDCKRLGVTPFDVDGMLELLEEEADDGPQ